MISIGKYKLGQKLFLVAIIALIFLIVGIINPRFFSFTNIMAILQQISVLGILTMAMALVLIIGGVDLSIGAMMVLSGALSRRALKWLACFCSYHAWFNLWSFMRNIKWTTY